MKLSIDDYRVVPKQKVDLDKIPTRVKRLYSSKKHYKELLVEQIEQLKQRQQLLYAHDHYSLLIIFQAMDAAGKDSAIKHVMSGLNPQGCQVFSFKHPTAMDLAHDFMWRSYQCLPDRGRIGIFNRSYYEEVLIVKVHPQILQGQNIPAEHIDPDDPQKRLFWQDRYKSIKDFESHLSRNGTKIIKFFLHLSPEEQRKRFLERIDSPQKNWKFSQADIKERQFWPQYMQAYEQCLNTTSSQEAPWFMVPADDKKNARLIISEVLLQTLNALDMHYPKLDEQRQQDLQVARQQLIDEDN